MNLKKHNIKYNLILNIYHIKNISIKPKNIMEIVIFFFLNMKSAKNVEDYNHSWPEGFHTYLAIILKSYLIPNFV